MDRQIDKKQLAGERRRRYLRHTLWCAVGTGALLALIFLLGGKSVKASDLNMGTVTTGPLATSVAASGKVEPAFEQIVSSPVASRILEIYVHGGDSVAAGQPLLRLDLQESETRLQQLADELQIKQNELSQLRLANHTALSDLEMQIEIKQMEVARMRIEVDNELRLDSIGSGTGERVRKARTELATGELQLAGLRSKLANERRRLAAAEEATALGVGNCRRDLEMMRHTMEQAQLPAPRAGVLTFVNTTIGATVGAGEKLAVVGDLSSYRVAGEVPEGSSFRVVPGADVEVRIGSERLTGTVESVEPQSVSGSVPFKVSLDQASHRRLRPGVRVQLYVAYGFKDSVLRIPYGGYYKGPGDYTLFVARGSDALERRNVTLGESNASFVEVVAGLSAGESVAVNDMKDFESYKSLTIKH